MTVRGPRKVDGEAPGQLKSRSLSDPQQTVCSQSYKEVLFKKPISPIPALYLLKINF